MDIVVSPDVVDSGSPITRIQLNKLPVSFSSNGGVVLKRNHHSAFNNTTNAACGGGDVFVYKECLKNHAANLGSHAVDGCGEFMPSPNCNSADPTSLKCAACGCHRNFHRREPDDVLVDTSNINNNPSSLTVINPTPLLEYQPHHRHHPPPPPPLPSPPPPPPNGGGGDGDSSPSSDSPPPISSSYYPSAPHLLLTLSGGGGGGGGMSQEQITPVVAGYQSNGRKRFRTRFTQEQKGKMFGLAEKLGWKMQRRDDGLINGICNEIGVERGVFKVWMHNNKGNFGKNNSSNSNILPITTGNNNNNNTDSGSNNKMNNHGSLNEKESNNNNQQGNDEGSFSGRVIGANGNGSSTSS